MSTTKTTRAKKPRAYINNIDLTAAVIQYQKDCKRALRNKLPQPPMPRYIGEAIMQICNRLTAGKNFNFQSYSYRDELIADGIERCVYAISKFNAKKATCGAFSYLTTVAIHAAKKRINDEKKQNFVKHKYFQAQHVLGEIEGLQPDEKSDRVVADFEEKQARKKLEQQERKKLTSRLNARKI